MNYPQAVAAAKSLLARIDADHWELARITHEVLSSGQGTIRGWAADLGIKKSHAATLHNVWDRFVVRAPGQTTRRSFADCYELAKGSEERAKRLEDRAEREGKGIREVAKEDAIERRDRVREARDLLRDRRRIDEVLDDPEIERAVERALRARRRHRPPTPSDGLGEQLQFDFKEDLASVEDQVYALLRQMVAGEVEKSDRKDVVRTATRIRNEAEWIIACMTSGDPALVAALERTLAKNAPVGAPPGEMPKDAKKPTAGRTPPPPPSEGDTVPDAPPQERRSTRREPVERKGPRRRLEPVGSG